MGSSGCDTQSQLLHGMWNLSGLGMEPVSPASAGGFPSIVPPGKSSTSLYVVLIDTCSASGCSYGVFMGEGEWRVFLLCHTGHNSNCPFS